MLPGRFGVAALLVVTVTAIPCSGQEKRDVEKRVKELLAIIDHPNARNVMLEEAVAARKELVQIGEPAAPLLVKVVLDNSPTSELGFQSARVLLDIGKPVLPAIRAKWADLSDDQRWRFMPVFEKHDPESVREYAWNCLSTTGWARDRAWGFLLRTKDKQTKAVYFDALETGGEEPEHVRWMLLPGEKEVYDFERETKILIALLAADSWVAKGKGQMTPEGIPPPWWPDGRPQIIADLRARKAKDAAPALLKVLEEKGSGAGYLAEQVIPALVEFGYAKAIPELEQVAAHPPKSTRGEDPHPYNLGNYDEVRRLADDAVAKLKAGKR